MDFSLMFFSSDAGDGVADPYRLVLACAEYADRNGFKALWLPERHFHRFGGLYPNPSVVAAAVAATTTRIRVRAGSVILPLHDPVRVAEEWSVVDNLSGGRVDLGFGQGWNANDFVLAPERYADRLRHLYSGIADIKALWRGDKLVRRNGVGKDFELSLFPRPCQPELRTWITCSGGTERFVEAGERGENILTALLFQEYAALDVKIKAYREARVSKGHDPQAGCVTLMLHTYVGDNMESVRDKVSEPLTRYLKDSIDLWRKKAQALDAAKPEEQEWMIKFAFERYLRKSSLCGTPASCSGVVSACHAIGVNELACLLDFGVDSDAVIESLKGLKALKDGSEEIKEKG